MSEAVPKQQCRIDLLPPKRGRTITPLIAETYKLRKACWAMKEMTRHRWMPSAISFSPGDYYGSEELGPCCTTNNKAYWLKNLSMQLAELASYVILPVIAAVN